MSAVFPYQHVIWDWNGTLFDDPWLCVEVINRSLKKRKMSTVDLARYREVFGFPVIDYYRRLGFDFEKESWEAVGTEWVLEYERRRTEVHLHKHARKTLEDLKKLGIGQSIVSAYKQQTLNELMDHFKLHSFFMAVHGLDHHYATSKEAIARKWMDELRVPQDKIVFIGDTEHDHEVAQSIGVDCILIPNGHQNREKLENTGARILNDLSEVREIVKESE